MYIMVHTAYMHVHTLQFRSTLISTLEWSSRPKFLYNYVTLVTGVKWISFVHLSVNCTDIYEVHCICALVN